MKTDLSRLLRVHRICFTAWDWRTVEGLRGRGSCTLVRRGCLSANFSSMDRSRRGPWHPAQARVRGKRSGQSKHRGLVQVLRPCSPSSGAALRSVQLSPTGHDDRARMSRGSIHSVPGGWKPLRSDGEPNDAHSNPFSGRFVSARMKAF